MNIRRSSTSAVALLLMLGSLTTGNALAHSDAVESEPADGERLDDSPQRVVVRFSQEIDTAGSSFQVFDANGQEVAAGTADLQDVDRTSMLAELPDSLPSGDYQVHWLALSAEDGDTTEGEFAFSVALAESEPTATTASDDVVATSAVEAEAAPTTESQEPDPGNQVSSTDESLGSSSLQAGDEDLGSNGGAGWAIFGAIVVVATAVGAGYFLRKRAASARRS